ncbi:ubinuclein-2-like [Argonauta hians]
MSDPRRLSFTTIGPMGKEKKKKSSLPPTIRFTLALRESNDKTCPEFSFADLMKNALGVCKEENDPTDFELEDQQENDRLVALAQSFEERYGPKHKKPPSKRLNAIQDLVDLGEGYDETDPFVDNSEAYDELVPACLTTKLGGFYINSGVLDFRDVSDESSEEFTSSPLKKRKKAKRVICSDPESDGEVKKTVPEVNKVKEEPDIEIKKKLHADKEFKKPRKPTNKEVFRKKSTVKELLKNTVSTSSPTSNNGLVNEKNGNLSQTGQVRVGSSGKLSANSGGYTATPLPVASTTAPTAAHQENKIFKGVDSEAGSSEKSSADNFDTSNCVLSDDYMDFVENIPKLPAKLPDHLVKMVFSVKQEADESLKRKSKIFTSETNKSLLELEMGCRLLNSTMKNTVYSHLAAYLSCNRETLLKRVKKLLINQEDKMKQSSLKEKEAVNNVSDQLGKYKSECQENIKNADLMLYQKNKPTPVPSSQVKPNKVVGNIKMQDISPGAAVTSGPLTCSSNPTIPTDLMANAGVTPILTTLANEMMDTTPAPSERTEEKGLWTAMEYIDCEENPSNTVEKSQIVTSALPKTSQEENLIKGEKLNPNECNKTVHEIGSSSVSGAGSMMSISSSSHVSSHVSVTHGSSFPSQNTSQTSSTAPSVKFNYSQHSSTTSLPIKNHQHGNSSQGHPSSSKQPHGEQKISSETGNVPKTGNIHSRSIQQSSSSPPSVVTGESPHYRGVVDSMSTKMESQHQQHNGQTTSNTPTSKPQQNLSIMRYAYPKFKSKDSSQAQPLNKLTITMANKVIKPAGEKASDKKDSVTTPASNSEKPQNSGNKSPSQSSKDDSKNTYLAAFQRYAASCLVSKGGVPAQKGKAQPISSSSPTSGSVSKAVDERCQVQQQPQHRNPLSHSLTSTSTAHSVSKIETTSTHQQQQRNLQHTHSQQTSFQHQKQQQQQKIQQNVVHGMPQNMGHSYSNKSHMSPHASKPWRQQQPSQQPHNRQQQPQKSYPSLVSSKPLTSSSQVVNPTNCQSSQHQQNHSKILPSSQFQTSRAISPHTSTTPCSSKHQPSLQCQSSSGVQNLRYSQPRQSSNVVTSSSSCNKSVSSLSSSQRTNIHSSYPTSTHSSQSVSLKQQQQQQSKPHGLISNEKVLTVSTATHSTSTTSSGAIYKLLTNIATSSGTVPTQSSTIRPPSPSHATASVIQHPQNVIRSHQGQNLHHQCTAAMLPMHMMGTQAKSSSNSCNTSGSASTTTTTPANAVSQGKSSASWNLSKSNFQTSAIPAAADSTTVSSSNRTSSPDFNSTSY